MASTLNIQTDLLTAVIDAISEKSKTQEPIYVLL